MNIFNSGISISAEDKKFLEYVVPNIETWLTASLTSKIAARRDAMIKQWTNHYLANSVTIPATSNGFINSIATQASYKTRKALDTADGTVQVTYPTTSGAVTLFSSGITVDDTDAKALLTYVADIEQWVRGAIAGKLAHAKLKLKQDWTPILLDDAAVTEMPDSDSAYVTVVTARSDYKPNYD
jgi:hypothetical protein